MLTPELIKANDGLKTLTEDQVGQIVELYANQYKIDSQKEIGEHTGNIYGRLDNDIESVIGQKKPEGMKTYEWAKKIISDLKTAKEKAESGNKGDEALKAENERLQREFEAYKQKSIESADATLRHKLTTTEQLLKDHETTIARLQGDVTKFNKEKEKILSEKDMALVELQTNYAFEQGLSGIKFKPHYSEAAVKSLLDAEKAKILSTYKPELVDSKDGKKTIQFRDKATGEILLNPANYQNPFTPAELLGEKLAKLDLLDKGRAATGTGTKQGEGGGTGVTLESVRSARSKVEADRAILDYLRAQGVSTANPNFNAEFQKLRQENGVADLPN